MESNDFHRRSFPPSPSPDHKPFRVLNEGWEEHKSSQGRTYYYNCKTHDKSWKPPRKNLKCHVSVLFLWMRKGVMSGTIALMGDRHIKFWSEDHKGISLLGEMYMIELKIQCGNYIFLLFHPSCLHILFSILFSDAFSLFFSFNIFTWEDLNPSSQCVGGISIRILNLQI